MHVMLCYSIYPPIQAGGAELIVSYLAEGLVERGHRVTVVSTCGPQMQPYPIEHRNGVEVLRFFPDNRYWLFERDGRQGLDKVRWHLRDAWNRACGRRLRQIIREYRPDVLHSHGVEGFSPVLWHTAKACGIPLVHTAHDYYMICPRALLVTRRQTICTTPALPCRMRAAWYSRWASAIDLFCSPSRFLLDQHLAHGLSAKSSAVVSNGIPLRPKTAALSAKARSGPLRALFAGRLTAEKGIRVALAAVRGLPSDFPIELTVAGRGTLESEVREAAAADPRIRYVGYLSGAQKDQAFSQADCLILPSQWYENAPVVIVEAAAYGLPVIASRLGAIPEFVEDGRNGLLFAPGDAQDLASTLRRLSDDATLLARLGGGGAALLARHSVAGMIEQYLWHYQQLGRTAELALA